MGHSPGYAELLFRSAMNEMEFWSTDDRFGLRIEAVEVKKLLKLCERSIPNETGGILLGRYSTSLDCAVVTTVTGAPADSQFGKTWFVRGVKGLQRRADSLWRRNREYYLGEWHFHPLGSPRPSCTDLRQLQEIADSEHYHCPEPVLLIIGGDPQGDCSAVAYVFRRERSHLEMHNR